MAHTARAKVILAAVLFAAAWFTGLGYRDLFQTDEGRYAEIPREMLATGDWVTPRLDGLKYFEKPPLQYWATAAVYAVAGESNATSRLWTALTGFLGLLMTAFAAWRLFGTGAAWGAAAFLGGSVYYAIMGHFNTLDMGVSFFMCASLFGFLLAMEAGEERVRRRWMYLAWAAAAFATLSKGLEAVVLPGAVFVLYVLITRQWYRFRQLHVYGGVPIYLVIAAPWFVLVSLRNPEFPQFFFIHEHFERFLTTIHHRYEPWWYFIPILLFGLLCFLPQSLRAAAGLVRQREYRGEPGRFNSVLFLWLWCGFIFLFFSLSDSKLGSYILPIFPALALLTGREIARLRRRDAMVSALICVALAIAALWQAPALQEHGGKVPIESYEAFLPWLMAGSGFLLSMSVVAFVLSYFGKVAAGLGVLAASVFLATQTVSAGAQVLSSVYSQAGLAREAAAYDQPGQPFYSVADYPQSLPFYLKRTMTIAAYKGELEFGIGQEPDKWIPSLEAFASHWRSDPQALAVMPSETYDTLTQQGLPMTVVARDPDDVIVRKP